MLNATFLPRSITDVSEFVDVVGSNQPLFSIAECKGMIPLMNVLVCATVYNLVIDVRFFESDVVHVKHIETICALAKSK